MFDETGAEDKINAPVRQRYFQRICTNWLNTKVGRAGWMREIDTDDARTVTGKLLAISRNPTSQIDHPASVSLNSSFSQVPQKQLSLV